MIFVLSAIAALFSGAIVSTLAFRSPRGAGIMTLSLGGATVLALPTIYSAIAGRKITDLNFFWALPGASFHVGLDALSACFLLLIILVCACAGLFGEGYLAASQGHLPFGSTRFFFLLFAAAMSLLVCSRNAILFMIAWEIMALSAFFLVVTEHSKPETRRAALIYLLCAHIGSLCLLALFALLGQHAGSLDFKAFAASGILSPLERHAAIALAILGFGLKAGFMPLHLWLQEAHPAAPSHVSAAMSGVMIEMGIYGLLRTFSFLSPIPLSVGVFFIAVGTLTAFMGILLALVQKDIKRLLAYSSVENIGIILVGMGLGYVGLARDNPVLAILGFTGAIFHTLNHGIFKSLLFFSAGSVCQALGSRDMEMGGGLQKRMPWTGLATLIGAAALCGLPPLNGFIGEWIIYQGLLGPRLGGGMRIAAPAACLLALAGALAAAALSKAYGILFLGAPRSQAAEVARDPGRFMLFPMIFLAALCLGIGIFPAGLLRAALAAAANASGLSSSVSCAAVRGQWAGLPVVLGVLGLSFWVLCAVFFIFRCALLRSRAISIGPTWSCGFSLPTSRMQYSGSSYSQSAARSFSGILKTQEEIHAPSGYWPRKASFQSQTPDPMLERWLPPLIERLSHPISIARRLQHGRLQSYLLYMAAFLIALLLWKL